MFNNSKMDMLMIVLIIEFTQLYVINNLTLSLFLYLSDLWQTTADHLEGGPYNLVTWYFRPAHSEKCPARPGYFTVEIICINVECSL